MRSRRLREARYATGRPQPPHGSAGSHPRPRRQSPHVGACQNLRRALKRIVTRLIQTVSLAVSARPQAPQHSAARLAANARACNPVALAASHAANPRRRWPLALRLWGLLPGGSESRSECVCSSGVIMASRAGRMPGLPTARGSGPEVSRGRPRPVARRRPSVERHAYRRRFQRSPAPAA